MVCGGVEGGKGWCRWRVGWDGMGWGGVRLWGMEKGDRGWMWKNWNIRVAASYFFTQCRPEGMRDEGYDTTG